MAKKKNNQIYLILAAAAGAIYYIVKKQKDQQKEAEKTAETAAQEAEKAITTETKPAKKSAPIPTAAERAYLEAVRKLQTALGISPTTGFVGDKTKAALRALKLTDVVTSGNVADLITKVEAAKKASSTPSKPVVSFADQLLAAWKKSAKASLILTDNQEVTPKLLDPVRSTYNNDPNKSSRTFYKGNKIAKADGYQFTGTTKTNKAVIKSKAGEIFLLDPGKLLFQG